LGGTFTGARKKGMIGILEAADNGTLFLDEVNSLENYQQAKLLRFLQEKEIWTLGAKAVKTLDVRVICAANQDLLALVNKGPFRADLYYRILNFQIFLPPLRDRREAIPDLAQHFVRKFSENKETLRPVTLDPAAIMLLKNYDWPGNVRQLENFLETIVATTDDAVITPVHINRFFKYFTEPVASLIRAVAEDWTRKRWVEEFERIMIVKCGGNKTKAAELLDIDPSTFSKRRTRNMKKSLADFEN
jgi:two-component system response regulator HydG